MSYATASSAATGPWPRIPDPLLPIAVQRGEPRWNDVRSTYTSVGTPRLILLARDERDVAESIAYGLDARAQAGPKIPFSVRSGGHGMSGSSTNDGGIVLDLSRMRAVRVLDQSEGLVRVGAGASWGDVATVLSPAGLALTSGNFGDTGVGGLASSGGVGYLLRLQGLTIDRIVRARLMTADGQIHDVSAQDEPDLYWGVRGGGSQLGVITEFTFRAARLSSREGPPLVLNQSVRFLTPDLPRFVAEWGSWIREAPRKMTSFLMLQEAGAGRILVQAFNVWAGADRVQASSTLSGGLDLAPVLDHATSLVPYREVMPTPRSKHVGQQPIQVRNVLVDTVDGALGQAVGASLERRGTALVELRSLGGAVADVPQEATAWAHRRQEALAAIWAHPLGTEAEDEAFAPVAELGTGSYAAYSADTRSSAAALAWPGETGRRLRVLAEAVDPTHLFDAGVNLRTE